MVEKLSLDEIMRQYNTMIYGKTYTQRRNELVVMFGENAVNSAEAATSKYVGPVTTKILFSKHFEACCYAAKTYNG